VRQRNRRGDRGDGGGGGGGCTSRVATAVPPPALAGRRLQQAPPDRGSAKLAVYGGTTPAVQGDATAAAKPRQAAAAAPVPVGPHQQPRGTFALGARAASTRS
jgi:hypothetical protein